MVDEEIAISGMHCGACEKVITDALGKIGITVKNISHAEGKANISYENASHDDIAQALSAKGYALAQGRHVDAPSKVETLKTWRVEKKIIRESVITLCILAAVQAALIFTLYSNFPNYSQKYILLLLSLPVAIVVNMAAIWHQRAYRHDVSCMTGMMIGMTIGMTSGLMVGSIIGLTNGMFFGSVIGTIVGGIAGVYAGKCCGVMGMMEGLMAGLMSGTMGAMLTVMMILDHAAWFIPFLYVVCIVILAGLMKVVVNEHDGRKIEAKPWPLLVFITISGAIMLALSAFILFAPKGLY